MINTRSLQINCCESTSCVSAWHDFVVIFCRSSVHNCQVNLLLLVSEYMQEMIEQLYNLRMRMLHVLGYHMPSKVLYRKKFRFVLFSIFRHKRGDNFPIGVLSSTYAKMLVKMEQTFVVSFLFSIELQFLNYSIKNFVSPFVEEAINL